MPNFSAQKQKVKEKLFTKSSNERLYRKTKTKTKINFHLKIY